MDKTPMTHAEFQEVLRQAYEEQSSRPIVHMMNTRLGPGCLEVSYLEKTGWTVYNQDLNINQHAQDGRVIDAIKELRTNFKTMYGRTLGLKDAKEMIEHARDNDPHRLESDTWGRFGDRWGQFGK